MTITSSETPAFRINWIWIKDKLPVAAAIVLAFASGGWFRSVQDQAADLPYKNRATAGYEQVEKVAGKNPVAAVKCLNRKADASEKVAESAVTISNFAPVDGSILDAIPDCPKVPASHSSVQR